MAEVERYRWIQHSYHGPEPIQPFLDGREYRELAVAVADLGDVVVAIEMNGSQGSRPEVLRAASTGGSAVSMFWNVNAVARFSLAEQARFSPPSSCCSLSLTRS